MPFSVIGVSETWLTDCTAELVNITGYNFVSKHCKSKTGGGVGTFFLQNGVEYKLLEESKFSDPDVIESLFLEILVSHGKNIVGCVYRPPTLLCLLTNSKIFSPYLLETIDIVM